MKKLNNTGCKAANKIHPDCSVVPVNLERLKNILENGYGGKCNIIMHHTDFEKLITLGCPDTPQGFADKYKIGIEVAYGHTWIEPGYPEIDIMPTTDFYNEISTRFNL